MGGTERGTGPAKFHFVTGAWFPDGGGRTANFAALPPLFFYAAVSLHEMGGCG